MNIKLARVSLLSALCLTTIASSAQAAGFYIQEQSVRGLGSAFSGSTTNLNDASTIYFNPAGLTNVYGFQAQAGINIIAPEARITDRGTTSGPSGGLPVGGATSNGYDPTPVPNGFVSYQIGERFWAGLGITAPFGLGSEYDPGWFGRFDSTKTELQVLDIQPTIAYKVTDWLSLGAGLNIAHSEADLRNAVVLGAGVEGNSKLTGKDWGFGYSFGAQIKPTDTTTIGLNYKSEVHHNLDGRIVVTNAAGAIVPAVTSDGSAKLTTPDHFTFGVAQKVYDDLTLQAQATWFGWNNFDEIRAFRDSGAVASAVQQNYQVSWAFAVGAEYQATPNWLLRTGVQFDQTPTTNEFRTTRTPDGDRTWLSAGATYSINQNLDLNVAGTYIFVEDSDINVLRGAGAGRTIAHSDGSVGIFALGLNYKF